MRISHVIVHICCPRQYVLVPHGFLRSVLIEGGLCLLRHDVFMFVV